jgi:hypothetical protein
MTVNNAPSGWAARRCQNSGLVAWFIRDQDVESGEANSCTTFAATFAATDECHSKSIALRRQE